MLKTDLDRRRILRLLATAPVMPGTIAGVIAACSGKKKGGEVLPAGGEAAKAFGEVKPHELPWKGMFRHFDLHEGISFASLRNEGLLVDFGTTDCFKYTLGGWRAGWGRSFARDGTSYTHVTGVTTRLFFHWDAQEEIVVRFRAKPFGGRYFSLYMNGKPVQKVDLAKSDWETYSVSVPAASVKAGENAMLLRWDATRTEAGEDLAGAMDWIHVLPSGAAAAGSSSILPTQNEVVGKARSGSDEAAALLLAAGMGLTYWMDVPEAGPILGFNLGMVNQGRAAAPDMELEVTARADGEQPVSLLSKRLKGSDAGRFEPVTADLLAFRGKVARLDVRARSQEPTEARVALVTPGVFVKPLDTPFVEVEKTARNVIVVMIDTLRADHTTPYAKTRVKTPVLDRLAREGVLYERFSAVEDWTKPSCATMLTGLYPCTHRAETEMARLPASARMISEEMKTAGVATAAFIANGYVSDKFGFKRGWDAYTNYIRESKPTNAERVFGDAATWIEANKDKRFFAYVHTIDPHVPYAPPTEFLQMYDSEPYSGPIQPRMTHLQIEDLKKDKLVPMDRDKQYIEALYDGEISYHDKWFGGFLQKLSDLGLLEDTLIVVVSDHGEEFWEHGSVGHGHQLHQELIHVPFILMWKGVLPAGVRVADNKDHAMLVPTIFDAMKMKAPSYLDGRSAIPRASGRQEPGPHAGFSTHQEDRLAVWSGRWKLMMNGPIYTFLYDVESDPGSRTDLDEERPITVTYLRGLLGQFKGASSKADWKSSRMEASSRLAIEKEDVQMDPELEKQLKALGYIQQ